MIAAGVALVGVAFIVPAFRFVTNDNLNQAARVGDTARCGRLLSKGANVNGAGMHAMKPVMSAARGGSLEAVKYLVSQGADVNAHNDSGSALMWAVDSGNEEMVQFLLISGADLNWSNALGGTALDFAREKKATNIMSILEAWRGSAEQ